MKLKYIMILLHFFIPFIFLLLFAGILTVSDSGDSTEPSIQTGQILSEKVLSYSPTVEQYAQEYNITKYVKTLLAIMEVETHGEGIDVMQSLKYSGLKEEEKTADESIRRACEYFAQLLSNALLAGCDEKTVIQAYNYGAEYITYIAKHGKEHTFMFSKDFAAQKSNRKKVVYDNEIAIRENGGWRYEYGNMFYVSLVEQYLLADALPENISNAVIAEALKYEGWKYVWGGSSPETSFDCSGLTKWCYAKAGIALPRTAQLQYDAIQHISLDEAQPGDLVFFTGTYTSGSFITHVGIYCGNNMMFHAGNPIGYSSLNSSYWQSHIVCAGRVILK